MIEKSSIFLLFCAAGYVLSGCLCSTPDGMTESKPMVEEPVSSTDLPSPQDNQTRKIFLVALEDAGRSGASIGCGDSLIPIETQTRSSRNALEYLLDQHTTEYGQSGLYNALSQSNLHLIRFSGSDTGIEVDLEGELIQGGVCDIPRIRSQLESTIRQSLDPQPPVTIRVNGVSLDELLSLK